MKLTLLLMRICYKSVHKITVFNINDPLLVLTDSEGLMDVQYIVTSDQLSVNKHANKSVANGDGLHLSRKKHCLVFTGHQLQVNQVKDWLRTCGRQVSGIL